MLLFSARMSDSVINCYVEYEGPVVPIRPNIQMKNPSFPNSIVPRVATFRVVAKLLVPNDLHPEREADNDSSLPPGYNAVPTRHSSFGAISRMHHPSRIATMRIAHHTAH